jgi:hypothetical protein
MGVIFFEIMEVDDDEEMGSWRPGRDACPGIDSLRRHWPGRE